MDPFFAHAAGAAIELFVEEDFYARVLDHPIHRGLRHMGLEVIDVGLAVVLANPTVEFPGHASDRVAVEDITRGQPATRHAAEEIGGVDEDHI